MQYSLDFYLLDLVKDPYNPTINFSVGNEYNKIGQYASALSYFLRAAEFSTDKDFSYDCLLKIAHILGKNNERPHSQKGAYLNAISANPTRPEAYFYLSQYHEVRKEWQESYTYAVIGLELYEKCTSNMSIRLNTYPGYYGLLFQKALSSWWIGLCDESRELFQTLHSSYKMEEPYTTLVVNNLKRLGSSIYPTLPYTSSKKNKLKTQFDGLDSIEKNYSQAYQDMFVLTMVNGKKEGTYLEIGSSDPYSGNNTVLLEEKFNWSGISIDIKKEEVEKFAKVRKNKVLQLDATTIDYTKLLSENYTTTDIDYLQIDCEPPEVSLNILLSIPFEKYRFGVITFEHDYYADATKSIRDKSRRYLVSMGYIPVATNIAPNHTDGYEDWWVHPDLINKEIIDTMENIDTTIKKADNYMFKE